MSIDRQELLARLKALPDAQLSELIFTLRLDDTIPAKAAPTERAIELIRAVEAQGSEAYERLVARVLPRATPADLVPKLARKISGSQISKHAPKVLFGRESELAALDAAWECGTLNIYTLVAWGGAGKTSLVFHWVQTRFAAKQWPGVERYFDWSFYSQGTGESRQTSADFFIAKALEFFGDPDPARGSPYERGERLAGLIRQYRTLLVLDGIEPLQYPPNDPQAGRLKDLGLEALLRELAADNSGLVVITTREHLTDVEAHTTTEEQKLDKLGKDAAVALLRHLQIVGTDEELHAAWLDSGGHALTLNLLGRYIADAYEDRDIFHYREVKFEEADQEHQGRSAFKVMRAYERWLKSGGPERQRELAVLRLTGLFDRPMGNDCLRVLRAEPAIPGLTDSLVKLTVPQWNIALKRLNALDLITISPDSIDAHPLIREHFATHLKRDQPGAFRAAHSRLFDYLCKSTPYRPDDLDGLAPLYQAVTHGCLAGRHQAACARVYRDRILRDTGNSGFYSSRKLGVVGADLAAVTEFFEKPWNHISPKINRIYRAWILSEAATRLHALGRLKEAAQPMDAALSMQISQKNWREAAICANNLSELQLTLGCLSDAMTTAHRALAYSDQCSDTAWHIFILTTAADAIHQSGKRLEAGSLYLLAERMLCNARPRFDLLYSLAGFRYCDWLIAPAEQHVWRMYFNDEYLDFPAEAKHRATTTLKWAIDNDATLLTIALDHLTLARADLLQAILKTASAKPEPLLEIPQINIALNKLRATGTKHELPRGLLTAALYHHVRGEPALAEKHLAEAQQIAERGQMRLHLADVHLHRARIFRDPVELAKAARLIRELGYGRRYEELADAEAVIGRGA